MPDPLIEVDRAISDLRRGALVKLVDGSNSILMLAAELLTADQLELLNRQTIISVVENLEELTNKMVQ
jgi:3,4-dihydroxy-2-butanone 4-phosphate synthase